jgi:hypothetical protein
MRCTIEASKLDKRGQEIAKLLGPIIPKGQRLACRKRLLSRYVVLSAYLGSQPTEGEPDLWRFTTKIPSIRASYHERWLQTDFRQEDFYLERAYLHLYIRRDINNEDEIFALHCDPNEVQSERHYLYKAGPHVHMTTAMDPLKHSHIALNNSNLTEVLSSVPNLTAALKTAIAMVDDQVLSFFLRAS